MPDPITGVSHCNLKVHELLQKEEGYLVDYINTSNPSYSEKLGAVSLRKIWYYLKLNSYIPKLFRTDIVYITPGQTFFGIMKYAVFIMVAKLHRKSIIIHIHGDYLHQQYDCLRGIQKRIFRYLIGCADKGIVLSETLKRNLSPFLKEKNIYVLHNFADDFLFEGNFEKDFDNLKLVFLSNLIEEKGINEFLKALELLQGSEVIYDAKIAGLIDPEKKDLLLHKMNALKHTEYLGVVKGEQKKKLLQWSNIFVLPTFYKMEGQPIAILEAMATGNVIITTNHAGIKDVITNGENGFLIEKRSSQDLLKSIKNLSSDRVLMEQMSQFNKSSFLRHFTFERFKNNFLSILEK